MIYLVSVIASAAVESEETASLLEGAGFRRVSQEEYKAKQRQVLKTDKPKETREEGRLGHALFRAVSSVTIPGEIESTPDEEVLIFAKDLRRDLEKNLRAVKSFLKRYDA